MSHFHVALDHTNPSQIKRALDILVKATQNRKSLKAHCKRISNANQLSWSFVQADDFSLENEVPKKHQRPEFKSPIRGLYCADVYHFLNSAYEAGFVKELTKIAANAPAIHRGIYDAVWSNEEALWGTEVCLFLGYKDSKYLSYFCLLLKSVSADALDHEPAHVEGTQDLLKHRALDLHLVKVLLAMGGKSQFGEDLLQAMLKGQDFADLIKDEAQLKLVLEAVDGLYKSPISTPTKLKLCICPNYKKRFSKARVSKKVKPDADYFALDVNGKHVVAAGTQPLSSREFQRLLEARGAVCQGKLSATTDVFLTTPQQLGKGDAAAAESRGISVMAYREFFNKRQWTAFLKAFTKDYLSAIKQNDGAVLTELWKPVQDIIGWTYYPLRDVLNLAGIQSGFVHAVEIFHDKIRDMALDLVLMSCGSADEKLAYLIDQKRLSESFIYDVIANSVQFPLRGVSIEAYQNTLNVLRASLGETKFDPNGLNPNGDPLLIAMFKTSYGTMEVQRLELCLNMLDMDGSVTGKNGKSIWDLCESLNNQCKEPVTTLLKAKYK